jgi:uncharacterized membrane protein YgdD (TMEM256/DUF423 family)
MERFFLAAGSLTGFVGVALGAFGAHALKARLTPEALATFEIGVRYQMYHALALIVVAWACTKWRGAWANASGWLFIAGIVVFSGSLYVLVLTGAKWLGAVTPVGGLALLAGWVCLALAALRASP